jgi:hypothetical protein
MKKSTASIIAGVLVVLVVAVVFPIVSSANHAWSDYHWARTSNPFTVKLGDNVDGNWDSYLVTAASDWGQSTKLNTAIVAGGTRPKNCRPTAGRDEVCNASYGNTGWLGVAQIWLTTGDHISQGTVKLNDYYFAMPQYNNINERQHVVCQEVGHTFGLAHQDESGISLNTCMDYYHNTSNSDTKSTHPNSHDYDELVTIYTHLDSFNSWSGPMGMPRAIAQGQFDTPDQWGQLVETTPDGRESTFVRDFGGGYLLVTHVTWATLGK